MIERLVEAEIENNQEEIVDRAIRPKKLNEYIGQRAVVEQMDELR